jgi:hypothetical protein
MINALDMEGVPMDAKPHASHKFGKKESTLVACASNDRFGSIRTCKHCGGREVWAGGAGSHYFDSELKRACVSQGARS